MCSFVTIYFLYAMCVCGELCVTDETGTGGGVSECVCAREGAGYWGERVGRSKAPDGILQLKLH